MSLKQKAFATVCGFILLPKTSILALALIELPFPMCLIGPVLFFLSFQSTWGGRITDPGAQVHPWQRTAEESVKHKQGWSHTVCVWSKCSREDVARMDSAQHSTCEWQGKTQAYRNNWVVMLIGTWQTAFCSSSLTLVGPVPETILTQFPSESNSSMD